MHESTLTPFWLHHARVVALATIIMAGGHMIGSATSGIPAYVIILHAFIVVLIAYPIQTGFAYLCMAHLPDRLHLGVRAVIGCLLAASITAVLGPVLSWFAGVAHPAIARATTREDLWQVLRGGYLTILAIHIALGPVLWMSLTYTWWRRWFQRHRGEQAPVATDGQEGQPLLVADNSEPPFMTKLPFKKRGALHALSAELHYVRVYTSAGNDLVLMRFSDAVAQCGKTEGLRIHRSHWVALSAIAEVSCESGNMMVRMHDSLEFPVSRSYQGVVRNALPGKVA